MEKILANALGQDISKLAAQEKQLLLSRLLARLAHEIRNPLSSLDIHVQLLEEDVTRAAPELRAKTGNRFDIIRGELNRLESIVKHFLSLAGPSSLDLHPVDIVKLVRHVHDLLQPEATSRNIVIEMSGPAELPIINADSVQLTQALVNLVINAIQAVDRNGRVEIALRFDDQLQSLEIAIHDSGPGVPHDKQSAIFEPFFTTKADGSGLGLWIAQQIVTAHGGSLTVESASGGGAIFRVMIPARAKACQLTADEHR